MKSKSVEYGEVLFTLDISKWFMFQTNIFCIYSLISLFLGNATLSTV
jgi:hypothetical protein